MIRLSIRRKIMGIAVTLIILMAITAVLTVVLVMQVGTRIEELTYSYMPAYGDLARANIRSLERALSIRRIIIEKLQSPADNGQYTALRNRYDARAD
jgi:predicted PurR-regulated permease PerM